MPAAKSAGGTGKASASASIAALNAMVDRLPRAGAIVIVHSHAELPALRRLLQVRRGPDVAEATRIIVAATETDEARAVGAGSARVVHAPFLKHQRAYAATLGAVWRL